MDLPRDAPAVYSRTLNGALVALNVDLLPFSWRSTKSLGELLLSNLTVSDNWTITAFP